jgi:hypothetical protein
LRCSDPGDDYVLHHQREDGAGRTLGSDMLAALEHLDALVQTEGQIALGQMLAGKKRRSVFF